MSKINWKKDGNVYSCDYAGHHYEATVNEIYDSWSLIKDTTFKEQWKKFDLSDFIDGDCLVGRYEDLEACEEYILKFGGSCRNGRTWFVANGKGEIAGHDMDKISAELVAAHLAVDEPGAGWEALNE